MYITNGYFNLGDIFTKRFWRFLFQFFKKGWDDSDTWNLNYNMIRFILPRLKRFNKLNYGYPPKYGDNLGFNSLEEFEKCVDKMIFAMECVEKDDILLSVKHQKEIDEGFILFGEHFKDLWW